MAQEVKAKGEMELLRQAINKFASRFGREPVAAGCAPGRVNLIGEHVDYCEGFVLPMALPFLTVTVGAYNNTSECNVLSLLASGEELETNFSAPTTDTPLEPGEPHWANYVKGVLANFPGEIRGFDLVIVSDVPMGAGVSSSASLEVAVFTFLEALSGTTIDLITKAKLCQKAEHDFPGMPCGIMDQYISTLAQKGHALLIDCRSLEATQIPLQTNEAVVLIVNSNVKHQLTGSEYPQRRAQCQKAATLLQVPSLRHAKTKDLEELKRLTNDELILRRAKHVVEEIHRTEEAAKYLTQNNIERVGQLFKDSHDSLSKLMEVSCPELDELVSIVEGAPGVYGARMTGGGFGGCLVMLVKKNNVESVKKLILEKYSGHPTFYVCEPSEGSHVLKL